MRFTAVKGLAQNKIAANFSSLTLVSAVNLILPFAIIPYLIHTLGAANYGKLVFYQYIGQFLLVVLDFGFPLYTVTEIAKRVDKTEELANFVSEVYVSKIIISLAVFVIVGLVVLVGLDPNDPTSCALLLTIYLTSIFNSFAPNWFFQGTNRLHETIGPTILARACALAANFVFVQGPNDLNKAALPNLLSALLLCCFLVSRAHPFTAITRRRVAAARIRKTIRESSEVFWSRLIITSYVTVSPTLIKFTAGPEGVAVYNLCEKVVSVARLPFDMFAAAAFANFSRDYDANKVKRSLFFLGFGGLITAVLLWQLAPMSANFLSSDGLQELPNYLALYGVALIPISMHSFLGTCVLLANSKRLELASSIVCGLVFYMMSVALLWKHIDNRVTIAIISMLFVEIGIFLSRLYFSLKYRLV